MKNLFYTLCEKAAMDKPSRIDVAGKVIAVIKANEVKTDWFWDRPLMWIATLSSAIAIPFVIMAIMLHNMWIGPLFEISQVISWAM